MSRSQSNAARKPNHGSAAQGRYGARPFEPAEPYADALLAALNEELHDVDYVTRDDLLYLSAFDHVATITRYTYIRAAVDLLIRRHELVPVSRTELALPAKAKRIVANDNTNPHEQYMGTIRRLVGRLGRRTFGVMDVVHSWANQDQHLTTNAKRVIVRRALTQLVREGRVEKIDTFDYQVVPAAAAAASA